MEHRATKGAEEIANNFNEYEKKQIKREKFIEKLIRNYEVLWEMSDNQLRRAYNDAVYKDEVYKKIWLIQLNFDNRSHIKVLEYFREANDRLKNRTMKGKEYYYLLNHLPEQILKDKEREFYPKKSLFQKIFAGEVK